MEEKTDAYIGFFLLKKKKILGNLTLSFGCHMVVRNHDLIPYIFLYYYSTNIIYSI